MSDNDSKTLDGSDGSTFEIDQGDRIDDNNPMLIPRIKTDFPDAEQVQLRTSEKLSSLTPEQRANLTIPSAQEQHSAGVRGDWQDGLAGHTQDQVDVSRMSEELTALQAEEAKLIASGSTVPLKLKNALRAKANSLNYQMAAMRRGAVDPVTEEFANDRQTMLDSYKTEKRLVVNAMMREEKTTREHAEKLIDQKIEVFGFEDVMPRYARVLARMQAKYPDTF